MLLEEALGSLPFRRGPAVALALTKRRSTNWSNDLDAQLDLERESQREAAMSADFAEGVQAFLRKRPPVFMSQRV